MSEPASTGPGRLVLVGTPIGNRGDLSPRAREALLGADLLLCEDTRSPLRLLGEEGSELPPRQSCFVGNEHARLEALREALREGKTVAFVSEAGMPVWSDPGRLLVDAAWELGAEIDAVPGPTAAATALALSGFLAEGARFVGFVERSGEARELALRAALADPGASIFYEAGNRTPALLRALAEGAGASASTRRVLVARELTKRHQELVRASVAQAAQQLSEALRGEVCVVLEGAGTAHGAEADADPHADARRVFELMGDASLKPRARAKALAELTGLDAREIYDRLSRSRD